MAFCQLLFNHVFYFNFIQRTRRRFRPETPACRLSASKIFSRASCMVCSGREKSSRPEPGGLKIRDWRSSLNYQKMMYRATVAATTSHPKILAREED